MTTATPNRGTLLISPLAPAVDCASLTTREINTTIRTLIGEGAKEIRLTDPAARHNLAVAVDDDVRLAFEGPVGWYAAGMNQGASVTVEGNCGWGVAECMMGGQVVVHGHAGSGAAASIRGGLVHVTGDAGARAGIAMKGGTLLVEGDVGYMSGFMMQQGTIIVGGNAADGLGDSMYEGVILIAGTVESYGADAVEAPLTSADTALLEATFADLGVARDPAAFRRVEAGRRLWNFSTKEPELWGRAL